MPARPQQPARRAGAVEAALRDDRCADDRSLEKGRRVRARRALEAAIIEEVADADVVIEAGYLVAPAEEGGDPVETVLGEAAFELVEEVRPAPSLVPQPGGPGAGRRDVPGLVAGAAGATDVEQDAPLWLEREDTVRRAGDGGARSPLDLQVRCLRGGCLCGDGGGPRGLDRCRGRAGRHQLGRERRRGRDR